jgi:hypothetical protein
MDLLGWNTHFLCLPWYEAFHGFLDGLRIYIIGTFQEIFSGFYLLTDAHQKYTISK